MKKSMTLYNVVTTLLSGVFKLLFRIKVVGDAKADVSGTIICANHMSNWDAVLIACMIKSPISFMAKEELFKNKLLGGLLRALGAFPISRDAGDLGAVRVTLGLIKGGNNICMFPQGTRYPGVEPSTTEVKTGVAMLLNHSRGKVLPVAVYTKDYRIKLFKKVYIIVGQTKSLDEFNMVDNSKEEYARISNEIFADICGMLDKAKDGEYDKQLF